MDQTSFYLFAGGIVFFLGIISVASIILVVYKLCVKHRHCKMRQKAEDSNCDIEFQRVEASEINVKASNDDGKDTGN